MHSLDHSPESCQLPGAIPVDWADGNSRSEQSASTKQIIEETDRLYDVVVHFAQLTNQDYQALRTTAATMRELSCNLRALVARSHHGRLAPTKIGSFPNHPCDI
jgi:hypothetical protein